MGRTLQDVVAEWIAKLNNREIGILFMEESFMYIYICYYDAINEDLPSYVWFNKNSPASSTVVGKFFVGVLELT